MKDLIAYAHQYIAFLFHNLSVTEMTKIKEIILFGSVARAEATLESDIDIFFNMYREDTKVEHSILRLTQHFEKTEFGKKWRQLGIKNDIKPVVGVLNDWNLKSSIIANGIVLYGKYQLPIKDGNPQVILYWDKVSPESKRVFLSKKLYGYSYQKKSYLGVLTQVKATKLSSNCVMIPLKSAQVVLNLFRNKKIHYKIIYVGKMS